MRTSRWSIVAPAALAMLTACGEVKTDYGIGKEKARAYVAAHPALAPKTADTIASNRIFKGMTMEQVTAAWGEPVEVQRFRAGAVQYWYFGCGWPHYCSGPDFGMAAEEQYQSRALFRDGKVIDWQN